ncbi:hypothetical protein TPHA_0I03290 [Tetrapisispora phaffii CBS 4417]|uniref:Glycogen debranching enzyme n=1 Tax=Tetrapisispora phaffii (strain ATCC 24235 / CBS 4417 / NBRC 1672 / NRRL Y-8282 / UCD 70-5) TaxID=1071381 RepID=G8BY52_TETPH|nr:hypothetical protein TPHA_0I03290 [Tetrapisispora phaffii CBS 4417]CCE64830.1 hypothetical protein TPHA_0I03290 [Tetrapisispora phaffii CBS 4417]
MKGRSQLENTLLLRLDSDGVPIANNTLYGSGVLTLPSLPYKLEYINDDNPIVTLKIMIAAGSTISRDGLIWTNVPESSNVEFNRDHFRKIIIKSSIHSDCYIDLKLFRPGSFCFYVSYRNKKNLLKTTKKHYFILGPSLFINDTYLPLNSINCQTIISKWLPKSTSPEDNWQKIFKLIANKKYNMIHFTPLQQRGESNSPYSIYDQLMFDPDFFKENQKSVKLLIDDLEKTHNMLSLTDIVFNHTANNSFWLRKHPESGYNQFTAPHLNAAIELDKALLDFSSRLKSLNYPVDLKNDNDLLEILDGIKVHVLGQLKLWEYYVINIKETVNEVEAKFDEISITNGDEEDESLNDEILNNLENLAAYVRENYNVGNFDNLAERYSHKLNIEKLIILLKKSKKFEKFDEETNTFIINLLDEINLPLYRIYDDDVNEILEQLFNRIKYLRISDDGPKLGVITNKSPLTEPYFTRFVGENDGIEYALANNGWIWNGNPLIDFASKNSKAYLRREVIVWGDCVKLRYGKEPADSPYLWKRMSDYITMNAKIFHGFRIDNCHSTPLHVGEYFLDLARSHNPNLYVVAELFSGSETTDCLFVERLGISSLIREAMQASSEDELSNLIHRYGGRPIGSYKFVPMDTFAFSPDLELDEDYCTYSIKDKSIHCVSEIMIPRVLTCQPPHALFMDCTHDNKMPYEKRTIEDTLPNAALVAFCSSAIGSVYGYDEIYPELLDLVNEKRKYDLSGSINKNLNDEVGICKIKRKLNAIRKEIAISSIDIEDSEMHVHHEGQYITFHRTNSKTGKGYYLIVRTKFSDFNEDQMFPSVTLRATKCKFNCAYSLEKVDTSFSPDNDLLTGVKSKIVELKDFTIHVDADSNSVIELPENFPPGSIAIFETGYVGIDDTLDHLIRSGALKATSNLNFESLNAVLFRSESEELDVSGNTFGAYNIPNHGKLVYCGLQGWVSVLRDIMINNDLAHPLSVNLREGHWALDYILERLNLYNDKPGIRDVQAWLAERFDKIKQLPNFLVPSFFALTIGILYGCCRFKAMLLFPKYIGNANVFVQSLALTSIQMVSEVKSTSIFPNINVPCMCAGLPHFSTNYMRCWGRDVFISFRGLLLVTGRYETAKQHILGFAKTTKHGLIPNLLDAGRNPRYNARDAAWFFLQAIQDYITIVPEGHSILSEKVSRRFPLNDKYITYEDPEAFSYSSSIEEIIYEILSRHAKGIKFREANAGPNLDRVMKDEGFNIEIAVDWSTGLIHGGNQFNCGTWMDKNGESEKAKSKGVPGTPRDGAAVEINGLLKSTLRFVLKLISEGKFKKTDVTRQDGSKISFADWNDLLQENFEKNYYIPLDPKDDNEYNTDSNIVNRRGIYKDLCGSGKPFEDYQLRPNQFIAMAVAPELFSPEHAMSAIKVADENIRGKLGMRTLDPSDYNYRPYYNNSEDSDDFATSKGRNYHQGPEWVWCYGYFMRSFHTFNFLANPLSRNETENRPSSYLMQQIYLRLDDHRKAIIESPWAGLPELTNKDGEFCQDSSPTQAWSSGCILDVLYDVWVAFDSKWYAKQIKQNNP